MPEPRSKSEADQPWYKRYPRDEAAETSVLTCDEYGALQRFRDYSLIHGGIEDDQEIIRRVGATFQLSKYKLKKIWNRIENFFTLREGRFYYEQDEAERSHLFVISCKRQLAGKLGAAARWSDRDKVIPTPLANAMANAIGTTDGLPSENTGELESEPDTTRGVSAAAASTMGRAEAAAAGPPPGFHSKPPDRHQGQPNQAPSPPQDPPPSADLSPHEDPERRAFAAITARCSELGMPVPSPDLAHQVVKKFPGYGPEDIARSLPRFPGQKNAALWLHKTAEEIQLEAQRQANTPGERKPTAREQQQKRMLENARRVDQSRAAGGKT